MRAWTIVLFILSIHAVLAMMTVAGVGNGIMNYTIDTSGHSASFPTTPGNYNVTLPSSDPRFFNTSANSTAIKGNGTLIGPSNFIGDWIESIVGVGASFSKLIQTFTNTVFSIHTLAAPYFGDFNAWVLEGIVDLILAIGLFQIVTGRSFKTME
jgi:hypothetical protein